MRRPQRERACGNFTAARAQFIISVPYRCGRGRRGKSRGGFFYRFSTVILSDFGELKKNPSEKSGNLYAARHTYPQSAPPFPPYARHRRRGGGEPILPPKHISAAAHIGLNRRKHAYIFFYIYFLAHIIFNAYKNLIFNISIHMRAPPLFTYCICIKRQP